MGFTYKNELVVYGGKDIILNKYWTAGRFYKVVDVGNSFYKPIEFGVFLTDDTTTKSITDVDYAHFLNFELFENNFYRTYLRESGE